MTTKERRNEEFLCFPSRMFHPDSWRLLLVLGSPLSIRNKYPFERKKLVLKHLDGLILRIKIILRKT
jgi:hypothetical protein